MIYIPSPPAINNEKTIFDYPELIEFIKQGKVIIDKGRKNKKDRPGACIKIYKGLVP